jgi:hypothetical protein
VSVGMNGCSHQQRGAATARSVYFRASGWLAHQPPDRQAVIDFRGRLFETRLQKLADPNACDPKTAAAAAASVAAPSTAATASSAAASVPGGDPYAACSGRFLAEDKESRQANVGYFLLGEDYRCGVLRRCTAGRNRSGCAARQRQRSSDDS